MSNGQRRSSTWAIAWAYLVLAPGCGGLRSEMRSAQDPVNVEVRARVSPFPQLEMSLVNGSDQPLNVYGWVLPWNFGMEFQVVSVPNGVP